MWARRRDVALTSVILVEFPQLLVFWVFWVFLVLLAAVAGVSDVALGNVVVVAVVNWEPVGLASFDPETPLLPHLANGNTVSTGVDNADPGPLDA